MALKMLQVLLALALASYSFASVVPEPGSEAPSSDYDSATYENPPDKPLEEADDNDNDEDDFAGDDPLDYNNYDSPPIEEDSNDDDPSKPDVSPILDDTSEGPILLQVDKGEPPKEEKDKEGPSNDDDEPPAHVNPHVKHLPIKMAPPTTGYASTIKTGPVIKRASGLPSPFPEDDISDPIKGVPKIWKAPTPPSGQGPIQPPPGLPSPFPEGDISDPIKGVPHIWKGPTSEMEEEPIQSPPQMTREHHPNHHIEQNCLNEALAQFEKGFALARKDARWLFKQSECGCAGQAETNCDEIAKERIKKIIQSSLDAMQENYKEIECPEGLSEDCNCTCRKEEKTLDDGSIRTNIIQDCPAALAVSG